jgi:2-polyprenyl-3-methyl-5-hydroxy-6-metoxy-1,4-benzoquinol methylase
MNKIIDLMPHQKNKINYTKEGHSILAEAEKSHFWFITRKELITNNILKYLPKNSKAADFGGGSGDIAHHRQNIGYDISLCDCFEEGLKIAQSKGVKNLYKVDINDIPFSEHFDAVCAFDVIEHFENDSAILREFNKSLKKNGIIFITVPAHPWLWGKNDSLGGHFRRYNRKAMIKLLTETGFEPLTVKHFFVFTLPLLFVRKLLDKFKTNINKPEEIKINKIINNILKFITRIENKILKNCNPKLGGSIFAAARKNN